MKENKKVLLILAAVLLAIVASGCSRQESGIGEKAIKIAGSTSVFPLITEVAEEFRKEFPDYRVEVQAGGSNVGIQSVLTGAVEIGMSSRDLTEEERSKGLIEHTIAYDCIVAIVNKDNRVDNLKLEQLKGIYTGEIKNWKEVGGSDSEIIVVNRDEASGTRGSFQAARFG